MTSTRPYLIRAFYEWIVDNSCTPHIVVNVNFNHVEVPDEYVDGGQIVLNIAMTAVQSLKLGDQAIEFQARFGGQVRRVYAPVGSILAIYAKENGRGMVFADEEEDEGDPPPSPINKDLKKGKNKKEVKEAEGKKPKSPPHLTVVK